MMDIKTLEGRVNQVLQAAGLADKRRVKVAIPEKPFNGKQVTIRVSNSIDRDEFRKIFGDAGLVIYSYNDGTFYVRLADNQGFTVKLTDPGMKEKTVEVGSLDAVRAVLAQARDYTRAVVKSDGGFDGCALRKEADDVIERVWTGDHPALHGVELAPR